MKNIFNKFNNFAHDLIFIIIGITKLDHFITIFINSIQFLLAIVINYYY